MLIQRLKDEIHFLILDYRCIERMISEPDFEIIYNSATDFEKQEMLEAAKKGDRLKLKRLMNRNHMTVAELRRVAQQQCIPDYHKMSKYRLIEVLNGNVSINGTSSGDEGSMSGGENKRG